MAALLRIAYSPLLKPTREKINAQAKKNGIEILDSRFDGSLTKPANY